METLTAYITVNETSGMIIFHGLAGEEKTIKFLSKTGGGKLVADLYRDRFISEEEREKLFGDIKDTTLPDKPCDTTPAGTSKLLRVLFGYRSASGRKIFRFGKNKRWGLA